MNQETIPEIRDIYGVESWSAGYFAINDIGNINVHPAARDRRFVDLKNLVSDLLADGKVKLPLIVRFPQLLVSQLESLSNAFASAFVEFEYEGRHFPVYPMKVNPRREVVEPILQQSITTPIGIECGSKSELYAALAQPQCQSSLMVCNGFKDESFVRMAILAVQAGKNAVVVIEKLSELRGVIKLAKEMGVAPWIGLRAKLYSRGSGKWSSSGGDSAKFGLTTSELLECIRMLSEAGLLEQCRLLHFHIGSQITDIIRIKNAMKEAARVYSHVKRVASKLEFVDIGGGLGVDYSGGKNSDDSSVNYDVQEFANAAVYAFKIVCDEENVTHPHLVTESGRNLAAYHSVFITSIRDEIETFADDVGEVFVSSDDPHAVQELKSLLNDINDQNYTEYYHDALELKNELQLQFGLGLVDLEVRAKGDVLFWEVCERVLDLAQTGGLASQEFEQLKRDLAKKYLCNFSIFRSLPDSWAINQLFPVMPIHKLDEPPTDYATLVDVTCDSDGIIDRFFQSGEEKCTLPLHDWQPGSEYLIGLFLVGAYQDVMGNHHNLFGHPNEVHVQIDGPEQYTIREIVEGSQISDMLDFAKYREPELQANFRELLSGQVDKGQLSENAAQSIHDQYCSMAYGSTFLD